MTAATSSPIEVILRLIPRRDRIHTSSYKCAMKKGYISCKHIQRRKSHQSRPAGHTLSHYLFDMSKSYVWKICLSNLALLWIPTKCSGDIPFGFLYQERRNEQRKPRPCVVKPSSRALFAFRGLRWGRRTRARCRGLVARAINPVV